MVVDGASMEVVDGDAVAAVVADIVAGKSDTILLERAVR
jgi:hypothetical protein